MCVVCVEWKKGRLTNLEAEDAIGELVLFSEGDPRQMEHWIDLLDEIEETK